MKKVIPLNDYDYTDNPITESRLIKIEQLNPFGVMEEIEETQEFYKEGVIEIDESDLKRLRTDKKFSPDRKNIISMSTAEIESKKREEEVSDIQIENEKYLANELRKLELDIQIKHMESNPKPTPMSVLGNEKPSLLEKLKAEREKLI